MTKKLEIPEDLIEPLSQLYAVQGGIKNKLWQAGIERGLIVAVPVNPLEAR